MKLVFTDFDTGDELNEWELNPSQEKFWESKKKVVLFSGGFGCLSGEIKIYDADRKKEITIEELWREQQSIRVLSRTLFGIKKAQALIPVRFNPEKLYTVLLSNGKSFTATAKHRVYTCNGWKELSRIGIGERILGYESTQQESISEYAPSILLRGVLRLFGILQDFRFGCRSLLCFCGVLLQKAKGFSQGVVPLPVDALSHSQVSLREGVQIFLRGYIQTYRESRPLSTSGSLGQAVLPGEGEVSRTFLKVFGRIFERFQYVLQFLLRKIHDIFRGEFYSPYSNPTIVDIHYARTDYYYDLHVLGSHNYFAEGVFHHNCGKSLMLILKAIDLATRYPKNYILMGRKTYIELRDTLLKEFFVICPTHLIADYFKAEMRVLFKNGSEIIFRHLDKISEAEVKSMNLGAVFIDQAEEISKGVFMGLKGRLRREGVEERRIYMTMNPELTWHFAEFKQNRNPDYELIEASTLENVKNLPQEYVDDLLKYPEDYKKQYVYGVWDESLLSGNTVLAREYLSKMAMTIMAPIREEEGLLIYKPFHAGHRFQMGIDVAEGSEEETEKKDKSSVTISCLTCVEECAHWSGQVPPDVVAEKAAMFARKYQDKNSYCEVLPEMNSIGLSLVNKLSQENDILIYKREEFDKSVGKRLKKLGWRTTRQSKPLLVNHFKELLRKKDVKVHTKETVEEGKTFIHTDSARKSGMGAKIGFHDDRLISLFLSFFEKGEVEDAKVLRKSDGTRTINVPLTPSLQIVNGRARFPHLEPRIEYQRKWTTT